MKLYKTLHKKGKDIVSGYNSECKWQINKWKKTNKDIEMCECGFHCSELIIDAMIYVSPEIIAQVEVRGKSQKQNDKQCWSKMRIIKKWNWTKKDSVALAIFSAELVIKNFEKEYPEDKRPRKAIQAAKRWLKNPTKENQSIAQSAAESTQPAIWSAQSAAQFAARFAAESAQSAAESAESAESAWSAAESAAWSAVASSKTKTKIEKWIKNRLEIKD